MSTKYKQVFLEIYNLNVLLFNTKYNKITNKKKKEKRKNREIFTFS